MEATGKAKKGQGKTLAKKILDSLAALKKFNEIISAQGKKKFNPAPAKFKFDVKAMQDTKIKSLNNKDINLLAKILGCPTSTASGLYIHKHAGDKIKKGKPIITLYSDSRKKLQHGIEFFKEKKPVKF